MPEPDAPVGARLVPLTTAWLCRVVRDALEGGRVPRSEAWGYASQTKEWRRVDGVDLRWLLAGVYGRLPEEDRDELDPFAWSGDSEGEALDGEGEANAT